MKKLLCAAVVAVSMLGAASAVGAADITASNAGIVNFSRPVDTSVFKDEYDKYFSYRVVDDKDKIYAYGQVSESGGSINFNFRIKGETGTYTLVLSNRKMGKTEYSIEFVNTVNVDYNDALDTNDDDVLDDFLIENGIYCGFDTEAYKLLSPSEKSNVLSYLRAQGNASTMEQLINIVEGADIVGRFIKSTSSASVINGYINSTYQTEGAVFNTAYAAVYAKELTDENKLKVASVIAGKTFDAARKTEFELAILKARVSQVKYNAEMQNIIFSDGNVWGFTESDLSRMYTADRNAVYKVMASSAASITSLDAYRSLLTKLIDENPAAESSFPSIEGTQLGSAIVGTGDVIFRYQSGVYSPYPDDIKYDESAIIIDNSNVNFKDLGGYEWAETAINKLVENYVISGITNTEFEPGRTIKREEFVKMITAGLRITGAEAVVTFGDVKESDWFYSYVAAAQRANIVSGDSDNNFGVGQNITRQDAAVIVSRALTTTGAELEQGEDISFTDEADIAGYAKSAVSKLAKAGIISGRTDGSFAPTSSITRAEAAQMLYGFLSKAGLLKW